MVPHSLCSMTKSFQLLSQGRMAERNENLHGVAPHPQEGMDLWMERRVTEILQDRQPFPPVL